MAIATNPFVSIGLILAQIGAVIFLSAMIERINAFPATVVYLLYAFFTGLTLSVEFLIYTQESIQLVFFITSFCFAGLYLFGYLTKRDLGPIGTFCHMGLWGIVGFYILSWIFPSLM